MPNSMESMTPEQLLADYNYVVVRYLDGEYAWFADGTTSLSAAKEKAVRMERATKGDYRVVRVSHE